MDDIIIRLKIQREVMKMKITKEEKKEIIENLNYVRIENGIADINSLQDYNLVEYCYENDLHEYLTFSGNQIENSEKENYFKPVSKKGNFFKGVSGMIGSICEYNSNGKIIIEFIESHIKEIFFEGFKTHSYSDSLYVQLFETDKKDWRFI